MLGALEGTLRRSDGSVPLGHTIVVFPEERARWATAFRYVTAARPTTDGRFLVDRILPGSYRVAVVTDPRRNEWFLPAFLERIVSQSVPVVIDAKAPARLNLVAGR
jgi:hypothetical protein